MLFNEAEALRSGTFICGMTGSGKSDLAMHLADRLQELEVVIFVIDPSQAWMKQSSIPNLISISDPEQIFIPEESTVFDISYMTIPDQESFVENFSKSLFMRRMGMMEPPKTWLILEEAQLYLPQGSLRARRYQETVRLVSVGRNFNLRFCLVTPFASQVDKYALKLCGQRYFGYATEPNDIDYIEGYLEDEAGRLRTLKAGQFIYECRGEIKEIYSEKFKSEKLPKMLELPMIVNSPTTPKSNFNPYVVFWAIFLLLLAAAFWR